MAEIAAPLERPSKWIILHAADLALLVATTLAIVPAIALIGLQVSAEVIFLYVATFASIGHHLPGYLRAYGDREWFQRFRWRLIYAACLPRFTHIRSKATAGDPLERRHDNEMWH